MVRAPRRMKLVLLSLPVASSSLTVRTLMPYSHHSCFIASDVDQSESRVVKSILAIQACTCLPCMEGVGKLSEGMPEMPVHGNVSRMR